MKLKTLKNKKPCPECGRITKYLENGKCVFCSWGRGGQHRIIKENARKTIRVNPELHSQEIIWN